MATFQQLRLLASFPPHGAGWEISWSLRLLQCRCLLSALGANRGGMTVIVAAMLITILMVKVAKHVTRLFLLLVFLTTDMSEASSWYVSGALGHSILIAYIWIVSVIRQGAAKTTAVSVEDDLLIFSISHSALCSSLPAHRLMLESREGTMTTAKNVSLS